MGTAGRAYPRAYQEGNLVARESVVGVLVAKFEDKIRKKKERWRKDVLFLCLATGSRLASLVRGNALPPLCVRGKRIFAASWQCFIAGMDHQYETAYLVQGTVWLQRM